MSGAGEKFSNFFFDPNELKSPKKQHVFLLFIAFKGGWVFVWVRSLIENSINFFIII